MELKDFLKNNKKNILLVIFIIVVIIFTIIVIISINEINNNENFKVTDNTVTNMRSNSNLISPIPFSLYNRCRGKPCVSRDTIDQYNGNINNLVSYNSTNFLETENKVWNDKLDREKIYGEYFDNNEFNNENFSFNRIESQYNNTNESILGANSLNNLNSNVNYGSGTDNYLLNNKINSQKSYTSDKSHLMSDKELKKQYKKMRNRAIPKTEEGFDNKINNSDDFYIKRNFPSDTTDYYGRMAYQNEDNDTIDDWGSIYDRSVGPFNRDLNTYAVPMKVYPGVGVNVCDDSNCYKYENVNNGKNNRNENGENFENFENEKKLRNSVYYNTSLDKINNPTMKTGSSSRVDRKFINKFKDISNRFSKYSDFDNSVPNGDEQLGINSLYYTPDNPLFVVTQNTPKGYLTNYIYKENNGAENDDLQLFENLSVGAISGKNDVLITGGGYNLDTTLNLDPNRTIYKNYNQDNLKLINNEEDFRNDNNEIIGNEEDEIKNSLQREIRNSRKRDCNYYGPVISQEALLKEQEKYNQEKIIYNKNNNPLLNYGVYLDQPESILDYQEQYDNSLRFYDGLNRQKNISQWTKDAGLPNTLMNNIGDKYCSPRLGFSQNSSCIGSRRILTGSISDEVQPTN